MLYVTLFFPENYTPACTNGSYKEGQIVRIRIDHPAQLVIQLVTPGYPFDALAPCEFILTVDDGKRVELEVSSSVILQYSRF